MLLFLTVLGGTLLGFAGAPVLPTIASMATLLTLLGFSEDREVALRFSKLGNVRVLSLALAQSVLSNLLFASISFALGRTIAWLVGGLL